MFQKNVLPLIMMLFILSLFIPPVSAQVPAPPPPTRDEEGTEKSWDISHPGWREREAEARAERAAREAEARAERAARKAADEKALNEAYQAAESSRGNAEQSAEAAQSKKQELAQLRKSMIDAREVDAANRRVQEALKNQAEQTARLDSLQRRLASIAVNISQGQVSFGTAVLMNEEDFYKKISPAQFVTPWMKQQAEKNIKAQRKELYDLEEQSRFLSTFSQDSEERIRLERQIQLKAVFGLGSDLLDLLPAPSFKNADKKLKVAYEATKSAVALMYTATAPDYVERTKKANESVNNLISLAALNPTLANDPKLKAAVQGMALSLKIASFGIDQDSKDNKNPERLPEEICYDYMKLALSFTGKLSPHVKLARALISVKERTDQYIYAEDAIKQILRMKEAGFNAEEYINDSILQVNRNLESSERIIRAYKLGDRK